MTAADVCLFGDETYTVTVYGWTGPDPGMAEYLNLGYPPSHSTVPNVFTWAADLVAREINGRVVAIRNVPDPNYPEEGPLTSPFDSPPKKPKR
ncbi:unnamed protein product [Gemmata massiliana]|uniref:Uncharacterized protein n=1 Tax=Gemmata massiliana TaxID=1210884 RepID=A0A6P2CZJ7_9BACT|nr:hypothetical protein [Gemmata massiliana]VTR93224.1 unnamed protein product [Gemmata massiliana]